MPIMFQSNPAPRDNPEPMIKITIKSNKSSIVKIKVETHMAAVYVICVWRTLAWHGILQTVRRPDIKILLALPGILMMLLGYLGCQLLGIPLPETSPEVALFASLTAFFLALALSVLFEAHVPSFRLAGGQLEGIVWQLKLTPLWALALSLTSGIGEELFFRGLLLGLGNQFLPVWAAVLGQALLFAAFHPAPRAAWGYTLWTGLIGILFGAITLASGSLIPTMLAHYLFNHLNFEAALVRDS
jgi:uncharacterized protein